MTHSLEILLLAGEHETIHGEIEAYLRSEGYSVLSLPTQNDLLARVRSGSPSAVLLSVDAHPEPLELVLRLRQLTTKPILVLRTPESDNLALDMLEVGADDFVCRDPSAADPIALRELRVRLAAAIRRHAMGLARPESHLSIGDLVIDTHERVLLRGALHIDLTQTEYELLIRLAAQPNRTVPHETLLRGVWSERQVDQRQYLRTYITRLRNKLGWRDGDSREGPRIESVRGRGYRLRLR